MEAAVQRYFDEPARRTAHGAMSELGRRRPTLEFIVLGAEPIEHAATPGVRFHLHVTEPEGREVYTIALSTQIQIDPARRAYDDATRERLVELFGAPERWGATTHSFQWARVESLVPDVHRLDGVHARGAVHVRPRGRLGQVLRLAARRRRPAQLPLQRHRALPRRGRPPAGRARAVELLGALADAGRRVEARRSPRTTRAAAGSGCSTRRSRRWRGRKAERGLHTFDDTVRDLL